MRFKNMKTFKYKFYSAGLCALSMLGVSCSDFSDYNEVPSGSGSEMGIASGRTLWENISQDANLSDFASLVKKSGFDAELSTPRSLTVWARKNGSFKPADYQSLSQEDLRTQLVKGHIAEYNHAASGKVDERVHMLNEKSFSFAGDGSYTFDGLNISKANIPSANGLMHYLDGAAKFYPNLYEYLKTGEDIDSLRNHFMRYEESYLDPDASVKGPMVNGVQTYIDSVMVTTNTLVNQLGARIANEDSTYTFVMPNSHAFEEMYNRVKPYYHFIETTKMHDVENFTKAGDTQTKTITVNATYMTDSLVRSQIIRNLIYSNNDGYNKWIVNKGEFTDTIRSTVRRKFSNPREILEQHLVGEPLEMSNGYVRMVDSLAFLSWETYCPELEFSPYRNLANLFPASSQLNRRRITSVDGGPLTWLFGPETTITEYNYGWIEPGGDRAKPDFCISMPEVMSATYNFYVVFMPSALISGVTDKNPNWLNFQLQYCDAKGATQVYNFSKEYADSLLSGGTLPKVPTAVNANTAFINDPEKTDTVFIGRFSFPVNYSGLGYNFYPSLRVTSPISVFNSTQLATYTRDVRIAAILLRPVELDEYEAKNK